MVGANIHAMDLSGGGDAAQQVPPDAERATWKGWVVSLLRFPGYLLGCVFQALQSVVMWVASLFGCASLGGRQVRPLEEVERLVAGIEDPLQRSLVLEVICLLPEEERKQMVEGVARIFQGCTQQRPWMIDLIRYDEGRKLTDLLRFVSTLAEHTENFEIKTTLLEISRLIPKEDRTVALQEQLTGLLKKEGRIAPEMVEVIRAAPVEERAVLLQYELALPDKITDPAAKAHAVEMIRLLPKEARSAETLAQVVLIAGKLPSSMQQIAAEMGEVFLEKRVAFFQNMVELAEYLARQVPDVQQRTQLFKLFLLPPPEDRDEDLVEALTTLFVGEVERAELDRLIGYVTAIPKEERAQLLIHGGRLTVHLDSFPAKLDIFEAFYWNITGEYAEVAELGLRLIDRRNNLGNLCSFLVQCNLVAPLDRERLLEAHLREVNPFADQSLREKAHGFLSATLEGYLPPIKAQILSELLSCQNIQVALRLADHRPGGRDQISLANLVSLVHRLSQNKELAGRGNNPYTIYQQMKRWEEIEVPVELERERIGETGQVRWNLQKLRERYRPVEYTRSDLAPGVLLAAPGGAETSIFAEVFHRLEGRTLAARTDVEEMVESINERLAELNRMSARERSRGWKLEKKRLLSRKEELQARFAGEKLRTIRSFLDNPVIQAMLHPTQEVVSPYVYKLYQMGKALAELDGEAERGSLSAQEGLLLAIAESIQNCSGGVREGIALFFANLAPEYRKEKGAVACNDTEEKFRALLDRLVQERMEHTFADAGFLRAFGKLGGEGEVPEAHHWSLFARGLLHRQVGYRGYSLQFDIYAGILHAALTERTQNSESVAEAIKIYFAHCKVDSLVEKVCKEINADLAKKPQEQKFGLMGIAGFLQGRAEPSTEPLFKEGFVVDCSEAGDYSKLQLTEKGAVALLRRAEFVL